MTTSSGAPSGKSADLKAGDQPSETPVTPPATAQNLLAGPPPTLLPSDAEAAEALAAGQAPDVVAARHPAASLPWAALAEAALAAGRTIEAYAYARTGYHRGLDALRRAGWRGHGPIPWSHEPNRGFLRALAALARAAAAIGEDNEATRCRQFLLDSDPAAARELALDGDAAQSPAK